MPFAMSQSTLQPRAVGGCMRTEKGRHSLGPQRHGSLAGTSLSRSIETWV